MTSCLQELRRCRGLSAVSLAERVGVTRQTIHAIESGAFAPNTTVALKLGRELGVGVEDLFQLADSEPVTRAQAHVVGGDTYAGAPLRMARVGRRLVATPWSPDAFALPIADATATAGTVSGSVDVDFRATPPPDDNRLLLAGCDPAVSVLADHLRRTAGVELIAVPSTSQKALRQLRDGVVHLAGTHINKRSARIPRDCRVFAFAEWEEGLVIASGNPKNIRGFADLGRRGMRIINRETGAGSRALLDAGLADAGIDAAKVPGYERVAPGHLAAAWAVKRADADCCVAPRVAARVFGLDFIPLVAERYDLAVPEQWLNLTSVQALLDTLQRKSFQRELAAIGGYDTASTGSEIARGTRRKRPVVT